MKITTWIFLIIVLAVLGLIYYPSQTKEVGNIAGDAIDELREVDYPDVDVTINKATTTSTTIEKVDLNVEKLRIANWNIQLFGKSKASKPELMDVYVDKLSKFDIAFVQEIRDSSETAFPELCGRLEGYSCDTSSRSGRSSSKEQYGVIYRDGIELIDLIDYAPSKQNEFERPPAQAVFDIDGYELNLINIHTKPDDVPQEMEELDLIASEIEGNVVVLGDLNADCNYYNNDKEDDFETWNWVISDSEDTTVAKTDCAYDRIIMNDDAYNEFLDYGIDSDVFKEQSDHYLIWYEQKIED